MKRTEKMKQLSKYLPDHGPVLCMCLACLMIFLFLVFEEDIHKLMVFARLGLLGASMLFCLISLIRIRNGESWKPFRLPVIVAVWFLITQVIQLRSGIIVHHYTQVLPVYLLALPFAAFTRDEEKQTGLKILTSVYLVAFLIWILFALLLMVNRVPQFIQPHVYWKSARLCLFHHPNNTARGFMLGIGLCLSLCVQTPKKWFKTLLIAAAALMFAVSSLTNSRSAITITCVMVGGIVFFLVFKGTWKQFLTGGILALVLTALLFTASQTIYRQNSQALAERQFRQQYPSGVISLSAQIVPEKDPTIVSDRQDDFAPISLSAPPVVHNRSHQKSFLQDLATFNSRTMIWDLSLNRIRKNPSILLWGTAVTAVEYKGVHVPHSHNSWLEVLLRMGLPGFVFSLIFTWQAVSSAMVLLWNRNTDLHKKILALLILCILMCSFFEPILFFSTVHWNYIDFFFFLCLGYMLQWKKQLTCAVANT